MNSTKKRRIPKTSVVKKTISLAKEVYEKAEAGAARHKVEQHRPTPNLSAYIAGLIVRDADELAKAS